MTNDIRKTLQISSTPNSLSYAGGRDGMETTERLVGILPGVLSARGCAYLLLFRQSRPKDVARSPGGLRLLGVVARRRGGRSCVF